VAAALSLIASAGPGEGHGHLSRALALAEAAATVGVESEIRLVRGSPSVPEAARAAAAGALIRPAGGGPGGGPFADGGPFVTGGPGAAVVDLPDPNEPGPDLLAHATVFDDSERLEGIARVIIQPSRPEWRGRAGAERVLAGFCWAPLGTAVLARVPPPGTAQPVPTRAAAVLVCFGGDDPWDLSGRYAASIEASAGGAAVTVVVGPGYRGRLRVDGRSVVRDPPDLVSRIASSDLAVIGGGTMKFEAAALGIPALLVAAAADQPETAARFAATGAARLAGDGRSLDPAELGHLVALLAGDRAARAAMRRAGPALVDGGAAARIVAIAIGAEPRA
jgi:spore coat polysaccharide biosynthesis predicted glycosyltransferase SpsG